MSLKKIILSFVVLIIFSMAYSVLKNIHDVSSIKTSSEQTKSPENVGGHPTEDALYGYWEKVDVPALENSVNPWPAKYQWFYFDKNKKIYSMQSNEGTYSGLAELSEIFKTFRAEDVPNFTYDGEFLKIDQPRIKGYQEIWGVNQFTQDFKSIKKGYLIMSLDGGSVLNKSSTTAQLNGDVIYYRVLRRIE